ncbi:RASA4 [Scenedesmus sp. PABB004]|nr:RASA4 [Scenedesmus sp. PABB004]
MAALASHPLRITDRDVLREASLDEWFSSFKGLDLHVRVLGARDLAPKSKASLPDCYVKVLCGPAAHRTSTQRRSLDPDWQEEFFVEHAEVAAAKRVLCVEVWAWDWARPDECLGRGFVDINSLAFEPLEVLELELQLHPPSVKKLKDVKGPKQPGGKKQKVKQADQAAKTQAAPAAAAVGSALHRVLSGQLLSAPSLRHYLSGAGPSAAQPRDQGQRGGGGAPAPAAAPPAQAKQRPGAAAQQAPPPPPELGTVRVALWWAPTWRSHAFDVAERVSFCLLPGEVKVPPVVTHAKLGTLYEEPCVVYIKLSLLEVQLGSRWYVSYLQQARRRSGSGRASPGADWGGAASRAGSVGGLDTADSLEAAVAAVVSAYRHDGLSGGGGGAPGEVPLLLELLGGADGSPPGGVSLAEAARLQQQQAALLQRHLAAEPVYALARLRCAPAPLARARAAAAAPLRALRCRRSANAPAAAACSYGKHQAMESNPVRLRPGGAAVFREQFVFIAKRPLQHKRLVLEVVLRGKALPGGKLVARGEWSGVQLLAASPPPPTTWAGVFAFRRCQLPGIVLPLEGIEGGTVELIAAAADADGRAAMYGVPQLSLEAAAVLGAPPQAPGGSAPASAPASPRRASRDAPVAAAAAVALARRRGAAAPPAPAPAAAEAEAEAPARPGAAAGAGGDRSWGGWLVRKLPRPLGARGAAGGGAESGAPRTPRRPSPFASSTTASIIAAAGAAAGAAGDGGGGAAGPALGERASPIAGLPVTPGRGMLSGPLATLQLVLHRVDVSPEPPRGWFVVLKLGQHWAKSTVRRDAEFAWQLSVPIYHPTTTLILVVFGDAGRGRLAFLGKSSFRISALLYLNRREVVKSLKLRVAGAGGIPEPSGGGTGALGGAADSPHPPVVAPGATVSQVTGSVLLGVTCSIPDQQRLLQAYERSQYPPQVHHISLFHAVSRDTIVTATHAKVVAWLSSGAEPPIPEAAAWKVLETGREKFRLGRARHNIQRLKDATSWVPRSWAAFQDLKAWVRPWHNAASVFVMAAICFRPVESLFAFLLWRSSLALRRLLMHGLVEYLGLDLGELLDTSRLLPSDLFYAGDGEDEDDDAASTASGGSGSTLGGGPWGGGAGGAGGAGAGGGGWGSSGGGGVRDLAAIMMFQPRRIKLLKRRYEQLLRISLQVQNRIDDIAMAMVTGQDPLATALFFWRCLLLAAALWAVGPGTLIFAWWCWEVLRPPGWRRPPGVKGPIQFVQNLPSKSTEEV